MQMKTFIIILCIALLGCSAKREGHFVMDKDGRFYRLTHESVLGNERYRLLEVDTTIYKIPFKCK